MISIEKYTGIYATSGDVSEALSAQTLHRPYMAIVKEPYHYIDWNGYIPTPPTPAYSAMPLTFEIISGGTIMWRVSGNTSSSNTISYSKDNGSTWADMTSNPETTISVDAGDVIIFKGDNNNLYLGPGWSCFRGSTAVFNVYGNIMSLYNSNDFANVSALTGTQRTQYLFLRCNVISAENLILPTQIANYSYQGMFKSCSGLTGAPILLNQTVPTGGYMTMFNDCSSLNRIVCLSTNKSADYCLTNWVSGVSPTGTFVKHPNTTWPTGNSGIPNGWTVIDANL